MQLGRPPTPYWEASCTQIVRLATFQVGRLAAPKLRGHRQRQPDPDCGPTPGPTKEDSPEKIRSHMARKVENIGIKGGEKSLRKGGTPPPQSAVASSGHSWVNVVAERGCFVGGRSGLCIRFIRFANALLLDLQIPIW